MRWFFYGVALFATLLAGLLWLFVFSQFRFARSVPVAAPVSVAAPPGRLPVAPVLRPLDRGAVEGCWRGYRARRWVDAQAVEHIEWIQTPAGRVRC